MNILSLADFKKVHGRRATTVMHRMRTWYNQQARKSERENDMYSAYRYSAAADIMTSRINENKKE